MCMHASQPSPCQRPGIQYSLGAGLLVGAGQRAFQRLSVCGSVLPPDRAVGCLNLALYNFLESTNCLCTKELLSTLNDMTDEAADAVFWSTGGEAHGPRDLRAVLYGDSSSRPHSLALLALVASCARAAQCC
jgi:hypothetical protein